MGKSSNAPLFYRDKPTFGIDIGLSTVKIMQIARHGQHLQVIGYGMQPFNSEAISNGIIVKPEVLMQSIDQLRKNKLIGAIDAERVCLTIPTTRAFIRSMTLPNVATKNLAEAVQLEVEQYIPMPTTELYTDYSIIRRSEKGTELLVVAAPKKIIDLYLELAERLRLEVVAIEPTVVTVSRLFAELERTAEPTILIDFGSQSSDIIVYDQALITADTVTGGGDNFTALIAKRLKIKPHEAHFIKTTYGLSKSLKQQDIVEAFTPVLEQLIKELKRIIRYYEERMGADRKITQIITMGGGANMPGLNEYLIDKLRLPARTFSSWPKINFGDLRVPTTTEESLYTTVAGLAMLNPKELFK